MDADLRIAALQATIDRQALRIADLEAQLVGDFEPPLEWRLPRRERQIFALLVLRPRVTKDMLQAIYADDELVDPACWESHVSKMRKRLAPFGVVIRSQRHLGYSLINRDRFRSVA